MERVKTKDQVRLRW